jgi:hypothetical protein
MEKQFSETLIYQPVNVPAQPHSKKINCTLVILFLIQIPIALCFKALGQNLMPSQSWTIGTGSVGLFNQNGTAAENIRELGMNPYGAQTILWKAAPDGAYGPDGGWDSQMISIDNTKLYRLAIWIKKTGSNDGQTYFGTGSSTGSLLTLDGTSDSNPYFWYGDLPELNKWYLLVGYIHPHNDPSLTNYGGIYDGVTGAKVASTNDHKFHSSLTTARHRAYLYYDYTTSDRQYFYGPEMNQMADNTPLVETSGSAYFNGNVFFGSSVGVGISSPYEHTRLQVKTPSPYPWGFLVEANTNRRVIGIGHDGTFGMVSVSTLDGTGYSPLQLRTSNTARLTIDVNGKIGIGTTSPDQQLTVKGKVHAEEVIIDLSVPAPDYVFEKAYDLESLDEVKSYIEQNKHLPDVPSAKEFEKNGITLGEMDMLLLKKVEELTLHLIKMNERLNALQQENEELKRAEKN